MRKPHYVTNAESKIKDHVAFFKDMKRDKTNAKMFDKEPVIFFKNRPTDYDYDAHLDCGDQRGQGVALRHRSPNKKHQQKSKKPHQATVVSENLPSSIE
jgi:hypothetical protein